MKNDNKVGVEQSQRQVQAEAPQAQLVLPFQYIGNLTKDSTTPSVKNVTRCRCINLTAVTITNFKDGQEGQEIIVIGDGNTIVEEGPYIAPGGGTHLLEPFYLYRFTLFDGIWVEFNYGGTAATAGGGSGGTTGLEGPAGPAGPPGIDGAGSFVPTFLADGDEFLVPEDKQALFAANIIMEGMIVLEGILIEVGCCGGSDEDEGIDGGTPDSVYGGTTPIDGGVP